MISRPVIAAAIVFSLTIAISVSQIFAEQRTDKVVLQGNAAGTQALQVGSAGEVRCEYSYSDRGRGDHITASWKVNEAGVPVAYQGSGNDYMKAPIEEYFAIENGVATWKNR